MVILSRILYAQSLEFGLLAGRFHNRWHIKERIDAI
jgi:hypothetical protein